MEQNPIQIRKELPRRAFQVRAVLEGGAEGEPEKRVVVGQPIVLGQETVLFEMDGIQYKEILDPGCLDGCDMKDVPLKYNHSDHVMIMARTRSKTMALSVIPDGVEMKAYLADTTAGNELYTLIQRGDIDQMSFAFVVKEESYNRDTRTWRVMKIKRIYDVAAVDFPAYDMTSISARSDRLMEIERMQTLDREQQRNREKELLLLRLQIKKGS